MRKYNGDAKYSGKSFYAAMLIHILKVHYYVTFSTSLFK